MTTRPSGPPERIFHTGRNAVSISMMVVGAALLGFGLVPLILTRPQQRADLGPAALALAVFILGGAWALGGYLLVFLREALAIYPDGLLVTNWRGRQRLISMVGSSRHGHGGPPGPVGSGTPTRRPL